MPRPIHFEVYVDDIERATAFYTDTFGWEIKKWEGPIDYWLVMTGPQTEKGIDGGMMKRKGSVDGESVTGYVCTMEIDDIDAYIEKVKSHDGTVTVPKRAIPTVGWIAYFKDTEGNHFGLMQTDREAK
jgi:uncharacterized protein